LEPFSALSTFSIYSIKLCRIIRPNPLASRGGAL
jgi:hypothetical protein